MSIHILLYSEMNKALKNSCSNLLHQLMVIAGWLVEWVSKTGKRTCFFLVLIPLAVWFDNRIGYIRMEQLTDVNTNSIGYIRMKQLTDISTKPTAKWYQGNTQHIKSQVKSDSFTIMYIFLCLKKTQRKRLMNLEIKK